MTEVFDVFIPAVIAIVCLLFGFCLGDGLHHKLSYDSHGNCGCKVCIELIEKGTK